jgi:uncharacterized membrane protein YhaH (DUF805 family)
MKYYFEVLQNYATFTGRARRMEYWTFFVFNFLISFILGYIGAVMQLNFLSTLYSLAVMLPSIAVAIRRMHDVGKSGWYCLIPIYNIILAFTEGDQGENEYGPDPKAFA